MGNWVSDTFLDIDFTGKGRPKPPNALDMTQQDLALNRVDTLDVGGGGVQHGFIDSAGKFQRGNPGAGQRAAVKRIESDFAKKQRLSQEGASQNMLANIFGQAMPDRAQVKDRSDVARDLYNSQMSLMAPQFNRQNNALLSNLQARGHPAGSAGFNSAATNLQNNQNAALSRLAQQANVMAGQEQSRQFGLDSQARRNAVAEWANAIAGGASPTKQRTSGNVAQANYSGLRQRQYEADLAEYQRQQAQHAALFKTLADIGLTIGGSLIGGPVGGTLGSSLSGMLGLSNGEVASAS